MELLKILVIVLCGGAFYVCVELCYRGCSHWSMFLDSGICTWMIGMLNELAPATPLIAQAMLGATVIMSSELLLGFSVNRSYAVWDYRNLPHNLRGQICPQFSCCWVGLSFVAILLDDALRFVLFGEAMPVYRFF